MFSGADMEVANFGAILRYVRERSEIQGLICSQEFVVTLWLQTLYT